MSKITLIGSGNVAWQLAKAFEKAGHSIEAVYSRNPEHANELASLFHNCKATTDTDFSNNNSDFFIVAISDKAIDELASKIIIPSTSIIAHTSGSVSLEALKKFKRSGVFYILQTFTKGKEIDFSEQPFGIEASDDKTEKELTILASSLSKNVQKINSAQRKILHIAAVFSCNFTNYLFSVSEDILVKEKMNFALLKPLITETVQKAFEIGPVKSQTGPAVRGDEKIMQQHLDYLKSNHELQELYKMISNQIKSKSSG